MALQAGRSEMTAFFNDGRYAENEKESSKGDHRAFVCSNGLFPHGRMRVYAMEGGTGQEAQRQESVSGNDNTGVETEGAEQPKDTGEQGDSAGSEDMEESGD